MAAGVETVNTNECKSHANRIFFPPIFKKIVGPPLLASRAPSLTSEYISFSTFHFFPFAIESPERDVRVIGAHRHQSRVGIEIQASNRLFMQSQNGERLHLEGKDADAGVPTAESQKSRIIGESAKSDGGDAVEIEPDIAAGD